MAPFFVPIYARRADALTLAGGRCDESNPGSKPSGRHGLPVKSESSHHSRCSDAKVVSAAQPRPAPSSMPARTSLRKCIPSTILEMAMLAAKT